MAAQMHQLILTRDQQSILPGRLLLIIGTKVSLRKMIAMLNVNEMYG
jgi:hypothetical protein